MAEGVNPYINNTLVEMKVVPQTVTAKIAIRCQKYFFVCINN